MTILLNRVTVGYRRDKPVLDEASAHFFYGQLTAVVGAAGSGKTTTLKVVAGLLPPTSGHVARGEHGELGVNRDAARGPTRFLPQGIRGRQGMSAARGSDHLLIDGEISAGSARVQRSYEHLTWALSGRPANVVLDEPFTVMDDLSVRQVMPLIERLRDVGASIVIGTTDPDWAFSWADRVVLIAERRLHQGCPADIVTDECLMRRARVSVKGDGTIAQYVRDPGGSHRPLRRCSMDSRHAARLVSILRDSLDLSREAEVLLQQSSAVCGLPGGSVTMISIAGPRPVSWLFACPMADLSPHEFRRVINSNPEGHTHVIQH